MSEDRTTEIVSLPGVRRDGTDRDSPHYRDSQWVRWQRGRPRKVGGYRAINTAAGGPIRGVHVDSRGGVARAHLFSDQSIEQLSFDMTGAGSGLVDRTPSGFVSSTLYTWQADSMFESGGGGTPQLICAAAPDLLAIDSDTAGPVYAGNITGSAALTAVSDGSAITTSGGVVVLQPCLFVYGSNGLIRNSNANDFSAATGWTTGGANIADTANVAGTKIVKGLPLRGGGNSPAGLFWALDSLIRVSFVGGTTLWQRDTVSARTTILSKNGPVEYDGVYFWPGVDRFFMYTGVVQELPNNTNLNWFFDNVNMAYRNKVWGVAVSRFGEIWWFYPTGSNTECNAVVIYNVRDKIWYDLSCARYSGASAQVFPYPVFAGGENDSATTKISYTPGVGTFKVGDTVTGGTTAATGVVSRVLGNTFNLTSVVGAFINGEPISAGTTTGTINAVPSSQTLCPVWQHEFGSDKIYGAQELAIDSYFETRLFSLTDGGPLQGGVEGANRQVRIARLEPDFNLSGSLELTVRGRNYPNSSEVVSDASVVTSSTEYVALREQRRLMSLKFRSNEVGGDFECGKNITILEPGDVRG